MRMTTAPVATPTMAPVERLDFAVVAVPPVLSGVELPELVVPLVVVLVGITVLGTGEEPDVSVALPVPPVVVLEVVTALGTGEELDVSVALPGAEVEDVVVTALVVDTDEDEAAIAVLLPDVSRTSFSVM